MNIEAIREQISAYIDKELDLREKNKVEKLIKTDSLWKAEYKAMKKTASILSQMDKIAVPEDMVKKVSTAITLSKSNVIRSRGMRLAFNLPKSFIFQYSALIIAAVLIVFAGSVFILRHKENQQEKTISSIKDEKWMDNLVSKGDKEMVKEGYKWYLLSIERDGSFRIVHIGESKAKGPEKAPSSTPDQRQTDNLYATAKQMPSAPGEVQSSDKNQLAAPQLRDYKKGAAAGSEGKYPSTVESENLQSEKAPEQKIAAALGASASRAKVEEVDKRLAEKSALAKAAPPTVSSEKETTTRAAKLATPSPKPPEQTPKDENKKEENMQKRTESALEFEEKRNEIHIRESNIEQQNRFREEAGIPETAAPMLMSIPKIKIKNKGLIDNPVLTVQIEISSNGSVNDVQIRKGSGDRWLDNAVKKALLKARFAPLEPGVREIASFILKIKVK